MVRRSLGTCHLLIVFSVLPFTLIVPEVGVSSLSSSRRNVDFPEPEDPMRKTNSPLSISVDTSSRAGRLLAGYSLVTCCSSITRRHGTCLGHENAPSATERAGVLLAHGDRRARTPRSAITDGCVRVSRGPMVCDHVDVSRPDPQSSFSRRYLRPASAPRSAPPSFLAAMLPRLSAGDTSGRLPRPGPLLPRSSLRCSRGCQPASTVS